MAKDFWNHNVPMVNPATGLPTPDFMRWLQRNREIIQDVDDGVAGKADKATQIITPLAGGLEGGGDLSADRTISLQDTGVTPGPYTNANITVDQKGRVTAAASGSGGGGGSLPAPADPPLPTPHGARTRWRLNVLTDAGPAFGNYIGMADIEFRNAAGVFVKAAGWTAVASTTFTGAAANVFDANPATIWVANGGGPQTIEFNNNGVAIEVYSVKITSSSAYPNEAPGTFQVQYWDGAAWVTAWAVTVVEANWTGGEARVFVDPATIDNSSNAAGTPPIISAYPIILNAPVVTQLEGGAVRVQGPPAASTIRGRLRTLPAGNFRATARIRGNWGIDNSGVGIIFRDTAGKYVVPAMLSVGGPLFEMMQFSSSTVFASGYGTLLGFNNLYGQWPEWIRADFEAATGDITFAVSFDGVSWIPGTQTSTYLGTVDAVGFGIANRSTATGADIDAIFSHFVIA